MNKLSYKLCEIENNTDISLYQRNLQKLHENILKYCGLDLFKEIAICFHHGLSKTSESLASLFDILFV